MSYPQYLTWDMDKLRHEYWKLISKRSMPNNTKTDDELRAKASSLLTGDYACTRVWEAWQVGTMTEDDFEPLEETDRVDWIVDLVDKEVLQVLDRLKEPTIDDVFPSKPYDGTNTHGDMNQVVHYYKAKIAKERANYE